MTNFKEDIMKIAANTKSIMKYASFLGFMKVRQRGTHMILKNNSNITVTLKRHKASKTYSQYHLKEVLSDLGSSLEEYISYLKLK